MSNRILLVDDDRDFMEVLSIHLKRGGFTDVHSIDNPLDAAAIFDEGEIFDIAVIDLTMPEMDGMELLEIIKNTSPNTECIVVTAINEARVSVKCLKKGAYDYLVKPVSEEDLLLSVNRALERKRLLDILDMDKRDVLPELHHKEAFSPIITRSRKLIRILKEAELHAASPFPVLITGESGTGKELLARAIHMASPRSQASFTPVNMAAINSNLFDSEFFGHIKGAFTGADADRIGYLEHTHGGTLFLDEIGILPLELQGKLLRVLQNGEYVKVGASTPKKADVRVVAATNEDLDQLIARRQFRKDLYYRIRGGWLHLPPLRERREDIPLLIRHFIAKTTGKPEAVDIEVDALNVLMDYDYPGNVRELESVVQSALNLARGSVISLRCLQDHLRRHKSPPKAACRIETGGLEPLERVEKCHILRVYELTGGNKSQSAKILGIGLNTLRRKLKSYGISPEGP
ncbi:MAG: sigma-54-dependent transcriptional regulator [Desulfobacterales bacterium]